MKRAFSLVELLIVIAIMGILVAVVLPQLQSYSQESKEAAAESNLHILRDIIERYAADHSGVPPGYPNDDPTRAPSSNFFRMQLCQNAAYLRKIPENPFNGLNSVSVIGNSSALSLEVAGGVGWVYKPATKEIRLATPGIDSRTVPYFAY